MPIMTSTALPHACPGTFLPPSAPSTGTSTTFRYSRKALREVCECQWVSFADNGSLLQGSFGYLRLAEVYWSPIACMANPTKVHHPSSAPLFHTERDAPSGLRAPLTQRKSLASLLQNGSMASAATPKRDALRKAGDRAAPVSNILLSPSRTHASARAHTHHTCTGVM